MKNLPTCHVRLSHESFYSVGFLQSLLTHKAFWLTLIELNILMQEVRGGVGSLL